MRPRIKPQRQRAAPKDDFDVALSTLQDEIDYLDGVLGEELKLSAAAKIMAKRDALVRARHRFAELVTIERAKEGKQ